jgi:hypothetical protein
MNEWLNLMLEEIRRKQREQSEALAEHRSREERAGNPRPAAAADGSKDR